MTVMATEIRIVIADDHPIVRRGLRQTIESDPALKVVAEAADGDAALALIETLKPGIAVLDIDMPRLDGLGVAREIRRKGLAVEIVFLSIHGEQDLFDAAVGLGSKGYLLKDSALTEIVDALRAVADGECYVTPALSASLLQGRSLAQAFGEQQRELYNLTPTERRILLLVAEGKSSKSMAQELFIHHRTVENHRTSICQKLNLHGHNALFKFALQHKSKL